MSFPFGAVIRTAVPLFLVIFLVCPRTASAAGELIKLQTRPGVSVSFWYMPRPDASATVVLLPGGTGGIGMKGGVPTSDNFLVRSRDLFAANGFNVAVLGRPSDKERVDDAFRVSAPHLEDLRRVVAYLKNQTQLPVWLLGTSRGTVSATAAAIDFGNEELAGIVLTASVTRADGTGAVPMQALHKIRIPVLVMHHEKDGCVICRPYDVPYIMKGLKNAPVKKAIMVIGGANPRGSLCEALHWHGFIGMEKEAVDTISGWIKHPVS